jgi:hypothetical protein
MYAGIARDDIMDWINGMYCTYYQTLLRIRAGVEITANTTTGLAVLEVIVVPVLIAILAK